MGEKEEALAIVRASRNHNDRRVRNRFSEFECGHWYARTMDSYAMKQGMTGIRYDAVTKTLFIDI